MAELHGYSLNRVIAALLLFTLALGCLEPGPGMVVYNKDYNNSYLDANGEDSNKHFVWAEQLTLLPIASCTEALETDAAGLIVCGTDEIGAGGSDSNYITAGHTDDLSSWTLDTDFNLMVCLEEDANNVSSRSYQIIADPPWRINDLLREYTSTTGECSFDNDANTLTCSFTDTDCTDSACDLTDDTIYWANFDTPYYLSTEANIDGNATALDDILRELIYAQLRGEGDLNYAQIYANMQVCDGNVDCIFSGYLDINELTPTANTPIIDINYFNDGTVFDAFIGRVINISGSQGGAATSYYPVVIDINGTNSTIPLYLRARDLGGGYVGAISAEAILDTEGGYAATIYATITDNIGSSDAEAGYFLITKNAAGGATGGIYIEEWGGTELADYGLLISGATNGIVKGIDFSGIFQYAGIDMGDNNILNVSNIETENITIDGNICGSVYPPTLIGWDTLILNFNESIDGANGETGTWSNTTLKAKWDFDEGTGNPADSSGNGHTITNNGADWNAFGKYGSALTFVKANTNDMQIADNVDFDPGTGEFTLGFWYRGADGDSVDNESLMDKRTVSGTGDGWRLNFDTSDNIGFRIDADTTVLTSKSGAGVHDNEWHYIVARRTATDIGISLDATAFTSTDATGVTTSVESATPLVFGARADAGAFFLNGTIDEPFFIKGVGLDLNEVSLLYESGRWRNNQFLNGESGEAYLAIEGSSLSYPIEDNISLDEGTMHTKVFLTESISKHFFALQGAAWNQDSLGAYTSATGELTLNVCENAVCSNVQTGEALEVNKWIDLTATWKQGDLELYVDGEVKASTETAGLIRISPLATDVYIARSSNAQSNELEGLIDYMVFLDRAITPQEAYCLYLSKSQAILGEGS